MVDTPDYPTSPGDGIDACWDTTRESFSLGGLLIFRQELELLAQLTNQHEIRIAVEPAPSQDSSLDLVRQVFASAYQMLITAEKRKSFFWPSAEETKQAAFSYKSFRRVVELWKLSGTVPTLKWSSETLDAAQKWRQQFPGSLYTIHLKQVKNGSAQESNATVASWKKFLITQADPQKRSFVLLGSDPLPDELLRIPGVFAAEKSALSLSVQLCLISLSDGFLGMATGICQAAIFSSTPYVIFKHPQHHPEEMEQELGSSENFPFAGSRQKIWRVEDHVENISKAFQMVTQDVS